MKLTMWTMHSESFHSYRLHKDVTVFDQPMIVATKLRSACLLSGSERQSLTSGNNYSGDV